MIYKRHYIQFNDLVFSEYDMIAEDDTSISYKSNDTEYGFRHGAYSPFKKEGGLVSPSSVSMTIRLEMKKLPCDVRKYYMDFVLTELNKQGKLWAVRNNTLIWAYAYVSEKTELAEARRDTLEIDVDFTLPEGIWHKADPQRTFLVPYDNCDFMDCYDYQDIKPCLTGDCCHCGKPSGEQCNCCECDSLTKEMALCYYGDDLQDFYSCHGAGYKVIYNCLAAERFFNSDTDHIGQKICNGDCGGVVTGRFYSDTVIPTDGVRITIYGKVKDPMIEINGNTNIVRGTYEHMTINPDGSVYSMPNGCGACLADVEAWEIPSGNDYGWFVHSGYNDLTIFPGDCCGTVCAFIEVDAITT